MDTHDGVDVKGAIHSHGNYEPHSHQKAAHYDLRKKDKGFRKHHKGVNKISKQQSFAGGQGQTPDPDPDDPSGGVHDIAGNVSVDKSHPLANPAREVYYLHYVGLWNATENHTVLYYIINDVSVKEEWASDIERFDSVDKNGKEKARDRVTALNNVYSYGRMVEGSPP